MKKMFKNKEVSDALERASSPVRWIWSRLPEALLGLFCIVVIIFSILTYFPAISKFASKLASGNKYTATLEGLLNPFRNRGVLLESGLPVYELKIRSQEYAKLDAIARESVKKGWMSDDLKVWADGQFFYNGKKYNVKVRLRGDLPNHWKNPKKSYRIRFGNQMVEEDGKKVKAQIPFEGGERQINLIIPQDREYILAHYVNSLMREGGLVSPRDRMVILRINGVLQGVYYEVEHFDKPLLAYHKRPETTIFGQNDRVMHFEQYTDLGIPATSDARFDIGSQRRLVEREGVLAMNAFQVLIDHSLKPTEENFKRVREVLNWEKYLRFRNMTTLCNTNHVRFGSDNLRLYYDPSLGLLEPVPWDVHLVRLPKEPGTIDFWNEKGPDEIQRATLENPWLRFERNKLLWEMVADGGKTMMQKFDAIYEPIRPVFWADVLSTPNQAYKLDIVRKNLQYNLARVHKVMSHSSANFTYKLESHDRVALELASLNFCGTKLQEIQISDTLFTLEGEYRLYEDSNNNGKLDKEDALLQTTVAQDGLIRLTFDRYIFPEVKYTGAPIENVYWEYYDTMSGRVRMFLTGKLAPVLRSPLNWVPPTIHVAAMNAVSGFPMPSMFISQTDATPAQCTGITAFDASAPFDLEAPNYTREQFLAKHPQFSPSRERPGAVELQGKVTIAETVIIPKNVPLVIQPGTDITMKPRTVLLSYGGLYSIGTAEKPIKIHGDGSGEPYNAVAVIRPTDRKVIVKHTEFRDGDQAHINGILFTGGFAVHGGDLELTDSKFIDMQSEDCLNLKYGHILMENVLFENSGADQVDLDFCTGIVRNCTFRKSGFNGDGLDVSGARDLVISGCTFENLTDKGISVGENSHPVIVNCLFIGNDIGVAPKDLSHPRVANSTFIGNRLAIGAYRKKPMFGGSSGEFVNCVFSGNEEMIEEDYFSKGKIKVYSSVSDKPIPGQIEQATAIEFAGAERNGYLLAPLFGQRFAAELAYPEWLPEEFKPQALAAPGIFPNIPVRREIAQ